MKTSEKKKPTSKRPVNEQARRLRRTKRIVAGMWITFGTMVVIVLGFFILTYNGVIGYMPPVEELKNPRDRFASIIYTADGQEMGRFYDAKSGNRVYADLDEISQHVVDALIATEDVRYADHSGIDFKAVMRAVIKTGLGGDKSAGGGSTITQQLAKQLYSAPTSSSWQRLTQKPTEWMIAIQLERFYSKEEIIKMYLNQFDFLYNAVGIKSAAQVYFNKDASQLELHEAAMLVGMVKNPALFNPVKEPKVALQRRNVVLDQMFNAGMISAELRDKTKQMPLGIDFKRVDHKEGMAPYFREELRRRMTAKKPVRSDYPDWGEAQYLADVWAWDNDPLYGWVEKNPKPDGSKYNLYSDGLRIYTTIDSRMQRYAEEAMAEHMSDLQKRFFKEKKGSANAPYSSELSKQDRENLIQRAIRESERGRVARERKLSQAEIDKEFNTPVNMRVFSWNGMRDTVMTPRDSILYMKHYLRSGLMSMDPTNGHVKAYVGGIDFASFQYDMVTKGRRQVGSTIKPFLYTLAMENGDTPCSHYSNTQPVIQLPNGKTWAPRNSGSARVGESVDLLWALTQSNNWISARLIDRWRPDNMVNTLHSFGITGDIPSVPSICLGTPEISLYEMVGAYSAFANQGMRVVPVMVTAIADNKGNIISTFAPRQDHAMTEKASAQMLYMLKSVVDNGTGRALRGGEYNLKVEMGGKTGTTNSNSDAWFMGFTPDLVTGVWVGGEEKFIHFNTMANGQGAKAALPIYGKYLRKVYNDPTLRYSEKAKFKTFDVDICGGYSYEQEETVEESTQGDDIFN